MPAKIPSSKVWKISIRPLRSSQPEEKNDTTCRPFRTARSDIPLSLMRSFWNEYNELMKLWCNYCRSYISDQMSLHHSFTSWLNFSPPQSNDINMCNEPIFFSHMADAISSRHPRISEKKPLRKARKYLPYEQSNDTTFRWPSMIKNYCLPHFASPNPAIVIMARREINIASPPRFPCSEEDLFRCWWRIEGLLRYGKKLYNGHMLLQIAAYSLRLLIEFFISPIHHHEKISPPLALAERDCSWMWDITSRSDL